MRQPTITENGTASIAAQLRQAAAALEDREKLPSVPAGTIGIKEALGIIKGIDPRTVLEIAIYNDANIVTYTLRDSKNHRMIVVGDTLAQIVSNFAALNQNGDKVDEVEVIHEELEQPAF